MKLNSKITVCAAIAASLAVTASGQNLTNHNAGNRYFAGSDMRASGQMLGAIKASDLIGMTVKNYQDVKLGKVSDLAVDTGSGRLVQVILSTGGFLGMGSTLVAVPPAALHSDESNQFLQLDVTEEKLKDAPKFDASNWELNNQSNQVAEAYAYYGQEPYFISDSTTNAGALRADTLPRRMDGSVNTDGPRNMDQAHNEEIARQTEATNSAMRQGDLGWARNHQSMAASNTYWSGLGYVQKGSVLLGTPVWNAQDEKLGKVENFIVDLPAGSIVAIIVSSGGYLGMGDELSAIPPSAFQVNETHDRLQLNVSKEALANAPHFKANEWPDFSQPGYAGQVYHAYQVDPYFSTNASAAADNTVRNVRDRSHQTITPLDQGNNQSDINVTAQIRREIIADKQMSMNAKNVKIITQNGRVSLRGPVNTDDEKSRIDEIANRVAQSGSVDNQLEVIATSGK